MSPKAYKYLNLTALLPERVVKSFMEFKCAPFLFSLLFFFSFNLFSVISVFWSWASSTYLFFFASEMIKGPCTPPYQIGQISSAIVNIIVQCCTHHGSNLALNLWTFSTFSISWCFISPSLSMGCTSASFIQERSVIWWFPFRKCPLCRTLWFQLRIRITWMWVFRLWGIDVVSMFTW